MGDNGSSFTSIVTSRLKFDAIASQLGLHINSGDLIPFRTGIRSSSKRIFLNCRVPNILFRDDATAFCPDCLSEQPYWRKLWLFRPYYVCTRHKKLLLNHCSQCQTPLKISRARLCICETCGFDFRTAKSITKEVGNVEWTLQIFHEQHQGILDKVFAFWEAHWKTSKNSSIESEHQRAVACKNFLMNKPMAVKYLTGIIINNNRPPNPRIELLPFLKSPDKEVVSIAREAINKIPLHLYINAKDHSKTELNRVEACLALEVTERQLSRLYSRRDSFSDKKSRNSFRYQTEDLLKAFYRENTFETEVFTKTKPSSEWITISQASEIISTNESAVRSLIKTNHLHSKKAIIQKVKITLIKKTSVISFNERYVLVGNLAKNLGIVPNNLNEKLASINILPIGGPYIDGSLVPFYQRADTGNLTKNYIDSIYGYQTKTGRPALGAVRKSFYPADLTPLAEAAKTLKISIQKAIQLMHKQILEKSEFPYHHTLITKKSLTALKTQLNRNDLININEAASILGLKKNHIKLNYVSTGIITIEDYYLWHFITTENLQKIIDIRAKSITAREASELLQSHRSFMTNLTRAGSINSTFYEKNRKIRFYDIEEFSELLKQLDNLRTI